MTNKTSDPVEQKWYFCDECGQKSAVPMPVHVSKYTRNDTQNYNFCSRVCHGEFYLARMRREGL